GARSIPTCRRHPLCHSDVLAGVRRGCTRTPARDARGGRRRTRHAQNRLDGFRGLSPATWQSSSTMAWRCCCLPAMSWCRTELAIVGGWLGACRPPWLLSSSEPIAVRRRPEGEVAIAMNPQAVCAKRALGRLSVLCRIALENGRLVLSPSR